LRRDSIAGLPVALIGLDAAEAVAVRAEEELDEGELFTQFRTTYRVERVIDAEAGIVQVVRVGGPAQFAPA